MSAERKAAISAAKKGIPLSPKDRERVKEQFRELNKNQIGTNHPRWRKEGLSYAGIHKWLERDYGKASGCENLDCKLISKSFQWAKLRGADYDRNRLNFIGLCASCHQSYDKNPKFEIRLRDLLANPPEV